MVADVPEECMGSVIEKMGKRKGDLLGMTPMGSRYRLEFLVPSRGLFGYRNEFLTDTVARASCPPCWIPTPP